MTIQTKLGERSFQYVDGHAWDGATWKGDEDFPFAVGRVYGAWQEPSTLNSQHSFEVTRDLITLHTEKVAGRYEIYEKIEGQEHERYIGRTLTTWGAKRKIAKRVTQLVDILNAEQVLDIFKQGK